MRKSGEIHQQKARWMVSFTQSQAHHQPRAVLVGPGQRSGLNRPKQARKGGLSRDKVSTAATANRANRQPLKLALWNRRLDQGRHELMVFGHGKSKPAGAGSR
ncbi:hypothetical protein QBC32DRAFT_345097 [Pseudoneurospora amorphoporcata]|uniref:Uncharacterized protein n=1 Tax=Pseudoneurospora amorphoporcata TaxID=241081 RepID=A0AAN6SES9_9PEZI|nr:hypothetical protein QBC32DRAFT_345097 [Pseudoneurospora amorphoporcata]